MKNNLEKIKNIFTIKKELDLSDISKNNISNFKNFVNAALLWATVSISWCQTLKPENNFKEVLVVSDFWYKEPEKDSEWYFLVRTDLKDEKEVSDGFSSIEELFTKLNSMTKTQVEPGFEPYYYGEIDEETWEKIPTFILVWEYHTDTLNRDTTEEERQNLKEKYWKISLVEENEDYMQTVEVIELLHDKFWIKNIWLEWEKDNFLISSANWYHLKNKNINYITLDSNETQLETNKYIIERDKLKYKILYLISENLKPKLDEEEEKIFKSIEFLKYQENFNWDQIFTLDDIYFILREKIIRESELREFENYFYPAKEINEIFYKYEKDLNYEEAKKEIEILFRKKIEELKENKELIEQYLKYNYILNSFDFLLNMNYNLILDEAKNNTKTLD